MDIALKRSDKVIALKEFIVGLPLSWDYHDREAEEYK